MILLHVGFLSCGFSALAAKMRHGGQQGVGDRQAGSGLVMIYLCSQRGLVLHSSTMIVAVKRANQVPMPNSSVLLVTKLTHS